MSSSLKNYIPHERKYFLSVRGESERQFRLPHPTHNEKWQAEKCDQEPVSKSLSCLSLSQHYDEKEDAICVINAATQSINLSIEQAKRGTQVKACYEALIERQYNSATPEQLDC